MNHRHVSFAVAACAALPAAACAQFAEPDVRVIHAFSGAAGSGLGWAVSGLRDLDGDGAMELIIPSPGVNANTGRIDVFSGRTGLPIPWLALTGSVATGRFGHAIGDAGDVNHDSAADVIVGSPGPGATPGRIHIFSGLTGALIREVPGTAPGDGFGFAVSGLGDLDGDGFSEVLVGAPGHDSAGNGAGRVYVLSGATGAVLRFHDGEAAGDRLGCGVTLIADLNADGIPDYSAAANLAGPTHRGRAYVWSGATGAPLFAPFNADPTASKFGEFFIGPAGDADHDGATDLYVGDYADSRAYVFSGRDGHRIITVNQPLAEGLGCGRSAGDINGDGAGDLAIGAYSNSVGAPQAGRVYIYSGFDGSIQRTITSTSTGEQFGFDAVGVGDLDADGKLDFLVGASAGNRAYVIAGNILPCYANCDGSAIAPTLNVNDFTCFINRYAAGDARANCDSSTVPPALNVNDFTCFLNAFATGCP